MTLRPLIVAGTIARVPCIETGSTDNSSSVQRGSASSGVVPTSKAMGSTQCAHRRKPCRSSPHALGTLAAGEPAGASDTLRNIRRRRRDSCQSQRTGTGHEPQPRRVPLCRVLRDNSLAFDLANSTGSCCTLRVRAVRPAPPWPRRLALPGILRATVGYPFRAPECTQFRAVYCATKEPK